MTTEINAASPAPAGVAASAPKNRLTLMIRKLAVERQRLFLMIILSYVGATLFLGMWGGLTNAAGSAVSTGLFTFCFVILSQVFASFTFSDLKTKEGRIEFIMEPASTASKFFPRVIGVALGLILFFFIGFYACETGRILTGGLFYGSWGSYINVFSIAGDGGVEFIALISAGFLFTVSVYTLGSALWPRYSFIKTAGALFALQTVLTILTGLWLSRNYFILPNFDSVNGNALMWGTVGGTFAISILLYYLAYLRIRKITV